MDPDTGSINANERKKEKQWSNQEAFMQMCLWIQHAEQPTKNKDSITSQVDQISSKYANNNKTELKVQAPGAVQQKHDI